MKGLGVAKHSVSLHLQSHPLTFPWKSKGSAGSGLAPQNSVSAPPAAAFDFHRELLNDVVIETQKGHLGTLPVWAMHRTAHFTRMYLGLYKPITFLSDSTINQVQVFLPNSCVVVAVPAGSGSAPK